MEELTETQRDGKYVKTDSVCEERKIDKKNPIGIALKILGNKCNNSLRKISNRTINCKK